MDERFIRSFQSIVKDHREDFDVNLNELNTALRELADLATKAADKLQEKGSVVYEYEDYDPAQVQQVFENAQQALDCANLTSYYARKYIARYDELEELKEENE